MADGVTSRWGSLVTSQFAQFGLLVTSHVLSSQNAELSSFSELRFLDA